MQFLADENIPKDAVVALRAEGHNVTWIPETKFRGVSDEIVWRMAREEGRILITADLDFPLEGPAPAGLVLVRGVDRISTTAITDMLLQAIRSRGEGLIGQILVVGPGWQRSRVL